MKSLNGRELAGFIKERQAKEVRRLKQAENVQPKLAIVQVKDDPVINTYVRLKQRYGQDVGVEVAVYRIEQSSAEKIIRSLNEDEDVHGIIVQLPLTDTTQTHEILNMVTRPKDVDGLAEQSPFDPATPIAINWLLAGFNIDLRGKKILIIGQGPLVGAPLARIFRSSKLDVETVDRSVKNLAETARSADVIVTATGQPALVNESMLKEGVVVVDAGVAAQEGTMKGDLADDVYDREDLTITPRKGGVGPLTVAALFDNVLRAARGVGNEQDT